jgi:hypothetical protein
MRAPQGGFPIIDVMQDIDNESSKAPSIEGLRERLGNKGARLVSIDFL